MTSETTGADGDALPVRELSLNQVVAANIAYYRQAAGLTQKQLGARVGWTNLSVSEAERSFDGIKRREFDAQLLASLAWALGVPVLALFLPPLEDDTEFRYSAGTTRMSTAELLELVVVPNSDDDSPAMNAYRKRFDALADRYLEPELATSVQRWLLPGMAPEARAAEAARFRRWAAEQREAAARWDRAADAAEKELP